MSDFLHRLAARAMGDVPVVQPIVPTLSPRTSAWSGWGPGRDSPSGA